MPDDARIFGGRWRVVRRIGQGGQGVVFEVEDQSLIPPGRDLAHDLKNALRDALDRTRYADLDRPAFQRLMDVMREVVPMRSLPRAAVKELLPLDHAVNAQTAVARMKTELEALRTCRHPAIVDLLDERLEERWFATELFTRGTLADQLIDFRGRVLESLRAIRPVVDAVATLHDKGFVHRDIKPANIFSGDRGLVLGDCGLAIKLQGADRLTESFENVGTRDYQPAWSYGMRLEDVQPTFDVFGLAKVIWAMVSGRTSFPLWYFDRPPHDLRIIFPDLPEVLIIHRLLRDTVVEHEVDCRLKDARTLLARLDEEIAALSSGATVPSQTQPMRCRFCGLGKYVEFHLMQTGNFANPEDRSPRFLCGKCGHIESFFWPGGKPPVGWDGQ